MEKFQTLVDSTTTAGSTYICEADLGTPLSDPRWRITLVDTAGSTKYPQNTAGFVSSDFEFIANNRATYTYDYINNL